MQNTNQNYFKEYIKYHKRFNLTSQSKTIRNKYLRIAIPIFVSCFFSPRMLHIDIRTASSSTTETTTCFGTVPLITYINVKQIHTFKIITSLFLQTGLAGLKIGFTGLIEGAVLERALIMQN